MTSLLDALTQSMRWHQQRQDVLAQNVANSDTPGYKGSELKPLDFSDTLAAIAPLQTATSDPAQFSVAGSGAAAIDGSQASFEVTPEGNGISVEDEMMKVTSNQMDYQMVTSLYTRSLQLIRTALGQ